MKHLITSVDKYSPAQAKGLKSGDILVSIDDCEVIDVIDYEQLTCSERFVVKVERDGKEITFDIEKDMYESLGLNFETSLMSPVKQCKNHCIFCFIDQMCVGSRRSLHFKDDDWRYSLIMGNYVTLTNVSDDEFERIIKRRVSPLYISVHATDGQVRQQMMRNPDSARIMQRLKRLADEKLKFHAQVVLCPGINDGKVLEKTIEDLHALYPYALSLAIVPVGLTKYRDGLYPLRIMTPQEAENTVKLTEKYQKRFFDETGERFVFVSDEMYIHANMELPPEQNYEDYPQIENGVGLLRKFESEFLYEFDLIKDDMKNALGGRKVRISGACGVSVYPFLDRLFEKLRDVGIEIVMYPIVNEYFGDTITVSGLVCGTDIAKQLADKNIDKLIIPKTMLRENSDIFLDGMTVCELEQKLCCKVLPLSVWDGGVYIDELFDLIKEG